MQDPSLPNPDESVAQIEHIRSENIVPVHGLRRSLCTDIHPLVVGPVMVNTMIYGNIYEIHRQSIIIKDFCYDLFLCVPPQIFVLVFYL